MIVKAESPPAEDLRTFHLSFLDQNTVRVYTQTLCVFPVSTRRRRRPTDYWLTILLQFPDLNNAEAAIQALDDGLRLTLQKFPFLAGKLSLVDDDSGRLQLQYPVDVMDCVATEGLFSAKQISIDDFNHSYEDLKRAGMPPSAFRSATFLPDDFANYPGVPINGEGICNFNLSAAPVMRVQACFVPGGLVLSIYVHHTVLDFHGISTFWDSFSANVSYVARTHGSRDLDPGNIQH